MLELFFPQQPPSVNRMWINNGFGGKVLSKESRKFQDSFKMFLSENYLIENLALERGPEVSYALVIGLVMPLYNAGYPKKAKTLFRKIDASNYIKLIEDCLRDVTNIEDSQSISVTAHKIHSTEESGVAITFGPVQISRKASTSTLAIDLGRYIFQGISAGMPKE